MALSERTVYNKMHGICIDVANPYGQMTMQKYRSLGIGFVRAELRVGQTYLDVPTALLMGPSTETTGFFVPMGLSIENIIMVIVGNEPDGIGDSSWTMSPRTYLEYYNSVVATIPPEIKVSAAGMVYGPSHLQSCWRNLRRKPDFVNKHYPNFRGEIQEYNVNFNRPCIVGEWCYKTAKTQKDMDDWVRELSLSAIHSSWFCLDEAMVPGFGAYSYGRLTSAGRKFRQAIRAGRAS